MDEKTSQPIHDGAHRKPGEIDEAGTSGATAQTVSPLHAQVWLRSGFQNSRTRTRVRRDTDKSGRRAYLKNQEKKCEKIFPKKSRKERNKSKKAENGNTNQITLISANVTSWKKNFNEIARLNPDIMALQETKVTKAAKPAANRAAGSENYSVIWGKPCDQLKKKREGRTIAQTPWLGRQGGVAVMANKEMGILAGGMEGKASCELYESTRYVRAAIPVRHGNRKLFIHVASLYNEHTGHTEVIKKVRNERALERAFTDAASLGDQAFFLCTDLNMTEAVSVDEALMTGTRVDVGTRYTTEDEAEPTYAGFKNWDKRSRGRNVTRPDRILANKLAMEMIQSFQVVRESIFPGHLPLKLTLNTAPLQQRITVVKVPKPFPIEEIDERKEEDCSTKADELANRTREEIEQARDGHDDQAWSLVSAVAENYLEWRCSSSKGDKRKGGKGRCGEPKTKECFLAASVGERSCDSPASRLTRKLQKSRRQAVEIQAKMNSRKAEEIDTRMQIIQLWTKIKKAIVNNRVPCQPVCKKMIPEERDINWFLNATQAMIKKIDKEAAERRI